MKERISFNSLGTLEISLPKTCLHCHRDVGFSIKSKTDPIRHEEYISFAITFLCPSCNKFSVYEYNDLNGVRFELINYSYKKEVNIVLPSNIEKISKQFVEIFEQAATAESYALKNICGVAYRKAAEFLIKDYAIMKNPSKVEEIKKLMLGNVISTYLNDFPKIQNLAKATAWIGNDETHYVRKHNDKDLEDLKAFLLAAATFIAADYDADQAMMMVTK